VKFGLRWKPRAIRTHVPYTHEYLEVIKIQEF
jgi:hypothetical protein